MASVYCLFDPLRLSPTEEADLSRVEELEAKILSDGRWTEPIMAHKDAHFVMDGHHRLTVAKRLNLASLPVVFLGYEEVRVTAWRDGESITPEDIVAMAQSGRLYPAKTTRHILQGPLPSCDIPLERLGCSKTAELRNTFSANLQNQVSMSATSRQKPFSVLGKE
ncbi:ParB N-terminal domain-containing protein [Agrobacterium radiobacter]|uniref:ParB N-terminal domain-containing protein n=1 Tax=Agrobacterium radiobacter TaxID=362 RepID=A0ABD5LP63_AGRRD